MRPGELTRVRFAFGLLGAVPVFLAGWLGYLQVAQAGELPRAGRAPLRLSLETAERQAEQQELLPAPRGTILDRNHRVLAIDCETYEVRARVTLPGSARKSKALCEAWLDRLADDVAQCLVADTGIEARAAAYARHRARLGKVLAAAFRSKDLPANGPLAETMAPPADVLLAGEIDELGVIEALRGLATRDEYKRKRVELYFQRGYRRSHPDRELTYGIVGHIETQWVPAEAGVAGAMKTFGVCGLESLRVLAPQQRGERDFLVDGLGRPYFLAPVDDLPRPNVLHSTLDIELQRIAVRELTAEADALVAKGTPPSWGALVLVEIATGDVLAAATWRHDVKHPAGAAFAPYQSLYEPGSIVKPLVLAYALEAGRLDWSHVFDCTQGGSEYRERIGRLGRRKAVSDDHPCGSLDAHGILVNSSNIGATYVGLGLDREQWRDYMRFYGFGESLALRLPHEAKGGPNRRSFDAGTPLRSFQANSAISFSFGYEMTTTAMQMARAYLRLFRGAKAELRVCRGAEVDGRWLPAPGGGDSGPRFRPEVVAAIQAAMVDVVSADPHATGSHLHREVLKSAGVDIHGLIAGKTGTAASTVGNKDGTSSSVRNASFVGVMPAEAPRWLAVGVLQKDGSARFYGGSYAAPPVVRLLLQAMQLEQRQQLRQDPVGGPDGQIRPVGGSPGDSGWGREPQRQGQ
ncbi:MAG: hypothetical protein IT455_19245 [Planctomycetes bacterium]|nr:hypothetical protein [Planctomycetota bacterium]